MRDRWKKKAYYTVVMILTALCLISGCGQESGEELKEISLEETQKEKEESAAEEKKVEDKEPKKETKIFVYLCGAVGKPGVYEVGSDDKHLEFEDNAAVCVVLASDGYPVSYQKGFPITGFDKFDNEEYFCFHAGTALNDAGQIVTNGGRVLGVTAKGKDLKDARAKAYAATNWISFENKYMRHDIGKAIDEA